MTIGILISPEGVPALLSDTMASVEGEDNHAGLPTRYRPDEAESGVRRLFRKSMILSSSLALTVAGEFAAIQDFVNNLTLLTKNLGPEEGVRKIIELSSDYSRVQAILVNAVQDGLSLRTEMWGLNVPKRHVAEHPNLGKIIAIGSGADKALQQTIDYGNQSEAFDELSKRPFDIISSFNQYMSGIKVRNELFFDEKLDWGGFLEHTYFDLPSGSWRRSPKCLYLFFGVHFIDDRHYTTYLYIHSFAYEPGDDHGGIFVKEMQEDGASGFEVLIEDAFTADAATSFGPNGWYNWKPEVANVCFLVSEQRAPFKNCNVTTFDNEINGVVFEIDAEKTRIGMSDWLADHFSTKAYQYTGWTYVPARELPDSDAYAK